MLNLLIVLSYIQLYQQWHPMHRSHRLDAAEVLDDEAESLRLRPLRGMRLFSSRSREREDSELESESESESEESEPESEFEVDESESDELERLDLRAFFLDLLFEAVAFSFFSLSFSFPSKIWFAVPLFFLNSSGTSTEGLPSAFSLASTLGFSSISVREGRETYGRVDLHS